MTIRIDGTNTTSNPGITGGDADTGLQFGTDEVKIVTGGSERALVDSSGYLRLAGAGLQFNGDTAAANALDDYEEGTWTPAYTGGTFTNAEGTYQKVGNHVHCCFRIRDPSNASGTSSFTITGLPYSVDNTNPFPVGAIMWDTLTNFSGTIINITTFITSSGVSFYKSFNDGSGWSDLKYNELTTGTSIRGSFTYKVS